jgi:predicted N-acetyltransferase YhbS
VFKRTITFEGQPVTLGGYGGTCTREDLRGRGIGSRLCGGAMDTLHAEGCDIAMLAVDPDGSTTRFYERQGYRALGRPFEIVTGKGERVTPDDVAMVAPMGSGAIFKRVLMGTDPLFLGPDPGYW